MPEFKSCETLELYSKIIELTENNDVIDGQFLMELYEIVDVNNKSNTNITVLNNIILSTIIAFYYDEVQNPDLIIKLMNRILPFDKVAEMDEKIINSEIWIMLLKLVTKGLMKEAVLLLTNYINQNSSNENIDDYKILLDILNNYPLYNLHDLKIFKNWKNLTTEYYSYISSKSDNFDPNFVLLVGVLNGNEKDISTINQALNYNSLHWGRLFLSFFLFYIPTKELFDEYLVKSLNYSKAKDDKNSIYQDFLIKDTSRIIAYVPILIDLDDVLGLTFIETLNKLNIISLDVEFMNLIYENWTKKFTESNNENTINLSVNQISILLKLIIQSSLLLSVKRTFVNKLIDCLILNNKKLLVSLNNNDVEYLIGILSSLRMPHTCKKLYRELGLSLLENISLTEENGEQIDKSSLINGLSILTKGLEYNISNKKNENDILSIILEKSEIILESNFKQFISSSQNLKDSLTDSFSNLIADYDNFNPILKQAFVCLKIIKALEQIQTTKGDKDYHKYLTYMIHLLKFEPLNNKFKTILILYYLNPMLIEIRDLNQINAITNNSILLELMQQLNQLILIYENDPEIENFIQDLLKQYPTDQEYDIQKCLSILIELFATK
ncbi:hypothetical protein HANVADRAFT_50950 [Hanseniaspora valbyensis NRRL Y-1626]|uniref:Uncharacterized protein n=1 Tax=Hanseniaspora valbyensis NRRL Y-1626 TaxID=766949 RepID=A0A1B7TJS1_9ASCO|nr:hypothetical protein HANVADRAFT_50950 [Hanseniaspora valbyensis NRRL Y-1626]